MATDKAARRSAIQSQPKPVLPFVALSAFLLGASLVITIEWIGVLYLTEILLLFVCFWCTMSEIRNGGFLHREIVITCVLVMAMACAYLVSDIFNGNTAENSARGAARSIFLFTDILGLYFVLRINLVLAAHLCAGYAIGQVLATLPALQQSGFSDLWKFGFATPATILTLIVFPRYFRRSLIPCALALLVLGMVHMLLDYRSLSGVCMNVCALIVYRQSDHILARRGTAVAATLTAVFVLSLIVFAYWSTQDEFGNRRYLGNAARVAALMAAYDGIKAAPWTGYGSWAYEATFGSLYETAYFDLTGRRYVEVTGQKFIFGAHSQLLQSWYEAGPVAALFFLYLAVTLIRSMQVAILRRPLDSLSPLIFEILLISIWHVFLSPFAGEHRFWIGLSVSIAILIRHEFPARIKTHRQLASQFPAFASETSRP
ncbi:MAG: hypothetical protein JJE04_04395 [Acidobacteriia bacterium]|nr:hypothetical protein [Terriglobia bacterium]